MEDNSIEKRILDAATDVFLEKGYAGTNMTLIAKAAGIGRPALYYYFRTKDKIFNELFGSIVRSFLPGVLEIIRSDLPIEERIETFVSRYFDQIRREPRMPLFVFREVYRDPHFLLQTVFDLHLETYVSALREAYEDEVAKGTLKKVPVYAILFACLGQIFFPFIAKPIVQAVFTGPGNEPWIAAPDFDALLEQWKPCVADSLRHLLLNEKVPYR